jgi:hypothetical protein
MNEKLATPVSVFKSVIDRRLGVQRFGRRNRTNPASTAPAASGTADPAPTTEAPTATEAPATEAPAASKYFTEEFDNNDQWTYYVVDGNTSTITDQDIPKMSVSTQDSLLTIDLNAQNLWVYTTYNPFEYDNVRIDTKVTNRGANNNNVSLICRHTDTGWYEFNVANNGLYWIYAAQVDSSGKVSYYSVYNGGSNAIKAGKETNEYTAICNGKTLSLFINGKEARTITDKKYGLTSGKVGISVSSFNVLPVTVDVDWVKISEP